MKSGKIAAVFAAAVILISMLLGEAVPLLQKFILQKEESDPFAYENNTSAPVSLKKGDYVYFGNYLDEPVLWKVLDISDGGKVLLMTEHIICFKPFDSCGVNGDYHKGGDAEKYGSSDWDTCTLKEWLNSSEASVTYSHCPPDADSVYLGYNAYADECGFLYETNYSSHLKSMISDEGVFLLTQTELKKYFTAETRRKTCTESAVLQTNLPYLITASKKLWYWTSSHVSSNNVSVAAVTSSGGFYKTLAYDSATGVCPSLYLKNAGVSVSAGDGSRQLPYVIS